MDRFISSRRTLVRWLAIALLAAGLVLLAYALDLGRLLELLRSRLEDLGQGGAALFAVGYVAATLLLIPAATLTIAAGAIFGLWKGLATVVVASNVAAAVAFLLARHLARERIETFARTRPRYRALDEAVGDGGWKVVALLRLSPLVPFSVGNYLFGATKVAFWPYVGASAIAMLPWTFLYVYAGYTGSEGLRGGASAWRWVLLGLGLAATGVVSWYLSRRARRALDARTRRSRDAHTRRSRDNEPRVVRRAWILPIAGVLVFLLGAMAAVYAQEVRTWLNIPSS